MEDIVFRNEDTGFTVMQVYANDELVTVVGEMLSVAYGEELLITGSFVAHPNYGMQFRAHFVEKKLPSTAAAILRYLSSGAIKGVGVKYAKKIVEKFGDSTIDIIEKDHKRLCEIAGITPKKAELIYTSFCETYGVRTQLLFLTELGISEVKAVAIIKRLGAECRQLIDENPYILIFPDLGLDFPQVDAIAEQLSVSAESQYRVEAGIIYVLRHNAQSGHTCLPEQKLLDFCTQLLSIDAQRVCDILDILLDIRAIVKFDGGDRSYIYLCELFDAESYIAGRISVMLTIGCEEEIATLEAEELILEISKEQGIEYNEIQQRAILSAIANNVFILTGGPGTGKTTIINAVLKVLCSIGKKVALVAPTGRAAKRMTELTGHEASTIHRLLEVDPSVFGQAFKHNEKNLLKHDVIIIDEMSMVDTSLLANLIAAMKLGAKLIMVGDSDQLPSVAPGNVLKDLLDTHLIPSVHLDTIFRQAAQSRIVTNAHKIVSGEMPDLKIKDSDFFFMQRTNPAHAQSLIDELCSVRLPKAYGFSPLADIQIISPTKKGPLGTAELNRIMQNSLNPPAPYKKELTYMGRCFREGDKIMHIKNDYTIDCQTDTGEESTGVFNGDIGIIERIIPKERRLVVRFDDQRLALLSFENAGQIELAYAITVHKSQGSEFDCVIMPVWGKNKFLHFRNLLYTAVTRAKKLIVLTGDSVSIAEMVANNRRNLRYTNLKAMLRECMIMG